MNDALNAAVLWVRVIPWPEQWPTVTTGEVFIAPFIIIATSSHLRNAVAMCRLWWGARRADQDRELRESAADHFWRAVRAILRLACWVAIDACLLTNRNYTIAVFTFGVVAMLMIEALDGVLDWLYQWGRARYWKQRDAVDDYAERALEESRLAGDRAEAAVSVAVEQGHRLEAALLENTALTKQAHAGIAENKELTRQAVASSEKAAAKSELAEEAANHVHDRFDALAAGLRSGQTEQSDRTERLAEDTNERMQQIVPRIVTPQEHDDADPPGSTLTVGEQIEATHHLAEQTAAALPVPPSPPKGAPADGQ